MKAICGDSPSGIQSGERLLPLSSRSSPSEPFTPTARAVRLFMSSFRGRAAQLASHDSKEFGAFCFVQRTEWASNLQRFHIRAAIHSAILLLVYHCFSWPSVPSVALHVVEFTFIRGFDSFRLTIFSDEEVQFAHGTARKSRWCAVEHRVIDWASRSPSRGSSK